jgi:hypothetical protein
VALPSELSPSGESTQQQGPTLIDVFAHLGDERVDRIEFQFISKMSDELHSEFLSIKVSVEVDEVSLEQ